MLLSDSSFQSREKEGFIITGSIHHENIARECNNVNIIYLIKGFRNM